MINKVILMGRLTRDPEVRHTSTGRSLALPLLLITDTERTGRRISSTALRGKTKLNF